MRSKPTMKVSSDFTKQFNETVKKFKNDAVLIGIPEDEDTRKPGPDDDEEIGNAVLLAITEFGSPLQNIPPWPVMAIGIHAAQDDIAAQFALCAKNVLTAVLSGKSGLDAMDNYYNRAGIIASTSIKKTINAQEDAPPLAASTLSARKANGFKGTSRAIVTGQMRNAITYVVRGG